MTAIFHIGALVVVVAAAVGSTWGLLDALTRPEVDFHSDRVSKKGWVGAFGATTGLLVISGFGLEILNAPNRLRTLDAFLFRLTSFSAFLFACWYFGRLLLRYSDDSSPS